jgi:L-fucose isomerase
MIHIKHEAAIKRGNKMKKPRIGVLGFSDGEPEVHEQLKGFVQKQMDTIVEALEKSGQVEVVKGGRLINSARLAKEESLKMTGFDVDGTIFSYGVFSFPNFFAIAA